MKRHCLNYSRSRGIDRIKSLKDTMVFTRVQFSTGFIPYVARVVNWSSEFVSRVLRKLKSSTFD